MTFASVFLMYSSTQPIAADLIEMKVADSSWWSSWGPNLVPLIVAIVALVGVVWTANRNHDSTLAAENVRAQNAIDAEDRRAKNAMSAELRAIGRESTLDALYLVAETVARVRAFNRKMSGSKGTPAEDRASAKAFDDLVKSFEGVDPIQRESLKVRSMGSRSVADAMTAVRDRIFEYLMALSPPHFRGALANEAEADLDRLMTELVEAIRKDFGADSAWGV